MQWDNDLVMRNAWTTFQEWAEKSLRTNALTAALEHVAGHRLTMRPPLPVLPKPRFAHADWARDTPWLGALFHTSPLAICITRLADGRITMANASFLRLTGYDSAQVIGHTVDEIGLWKNPNDRARIADMVRERGTIREIETAWRTRQGEIRYGLVSAESIDLDGEPAMLMLAHDITARKRAEEEQRRLLNQIRASRGRLQMLSQRLLQVQESERRQLARELHDEIGQSLTGLKFVLEAAARAPADNASRIGEAQTLVNELIARVRNLSLELRPAMLDDLGLLPALLWLIGRFTSQTQIHIEFGQSGLEQRFAPEIETATYRIAQETLTNVARHANTTEVSLRFWIDETVLHLEVEDWGAGFDVEDALTPGRSSGLIGMCERAGLLGGRVLIESVRGVGTRIHAALPLDGRHLERRTYGRNNVAGR